MKADGARRPNSEFIIQNSKLISDPRHHPIREEIAGLYRRENGLEPPWTGHHGKALKRLLDANRTWPLDVWLRSVRNRFASEGINPAADPIGWIKRLPDYARGPLDKFGGLKRLSAEQAVEEYWRNKQ